MTNISRGLILESLLLLAFMFLGWFLFSFLCCVLNIPFYVIVIAYLTSIYMYIIMSTSCTSSKPCISIAHHELIFQNDFYRDVRQQQGYDWMKSLFFLPIFFLPEMQIQFFSTHCETMGSCMPLFPYFPSYPSQGCPIADLPCGKLT